MRLHTVPDVPTPLGDIRLVATDRGVCGLAWVDRWRRVEASLARRFGPHEHHPAPGDDGPAVSAVAALRAYFGGDVAALESVTVDVAGSSFQTAVWAALRRIPAASPWSYAELATAVGRPTAVRAAGSANGANPVSIVIPCHRVVRTGGALGGYGGGLDRKQWLLDHERANTSAA